MAKHKRKDWMMVRLLRKYWPQVQHVVDAQHKLVIHVGDSDVAGAIPKDPANCVLARACIREQEVDAVLVFPSRAYVLQGTLATRFDVPETVTREIAVLDRGGTPAPGKYHFGPPPKQGRMGYHNPKKKGGTLDGSRPRKKPLEITHARTEGIRPSLLG